MLSIGQSHLRRTFRIRSDRELFARPSVGGPPRARAAAAALAERPLALLCELDVGRFHPSSVYDVATGTPGQSISRAA